MLVISNTELEKINKKCEITNIGERVNEGSRKPSHNSRRHVDRSRHYLWNGSVNWLFIDRCWSTRIDSLLDSIEEPRRTILRNQYALKALGVLMRSIGSFLMWNGSILRARTSFIATVFGITSSGLILSRPKLSQ